MNPKYKYIQQCNKHTTKLKVRNDSTHCTQKEEYLGVDTVKTVK